MTEKPSIWSTEYLDWRQIRPIEWGSLIERMQGAQQRYGDFASTHEALGVALEEWTELLSAIHSNDMTAIRAEALDVAAVLIRLAYQCRTSTAMKERSVK